MSEIKLIVNEIKLVKEISDDCEVLRAGREMYDFDSYNHRLFNNVIDIWNSNAIVELSEILRIFEEK